MKREKLADAAAALVCFLLACAVYLFTRSQSLGFADAAEFALVTKIGSVAHGPGFPSYVMLGGIWAWLVSLLGASHFFSIQLFSVVSVAGAGVLLYFTSSRLTARLYTDIPVLYHRIIGVVTAIGFSYGYTAWQWSNNIEVYGFHLLCFALMLFGAVQYNRYRSVNYLVLTAIGVALGLANHHLTILFFLPFLVLFAGADLFAAPAPVADTGKKKNKQAPVQHNLFTFFKSKQAWWFAGIAAGVTIFFYAWLMYSAGLDKPFKFGRPDTVGRLFAHLTGQAWAKQTMEQVDGIVGMRLPYFAWVFLHQFGFFIAFMVFGAIEIYRQKWFRFLGIATGYFLALQVYQLRLNQSGDSDAYMLLPYYLLALLIPIGIVYVLRWGKLALLLGGLFVIIQLSWNFPLADKRQFDLSKSQMQMLSESAPLNSVVFVSDWTLISQYNYYRLTENFRPDLTVLFYDVKFTEYTALKVMYPAFYAQIQPEYEAYIAELGRAHPEQLYNTGCNIDNPQLLAAFKNVLAKISTVCRAQHGKLLFDASAYVYYVESKLITVPPYVSGYLMAYERGEVVESFAKLPFKWHTLPCTEYDPAAANKVMDLYVILDYTLRHYQAINDTRNYAIAEKSYRQILQLQKRMHEHIPYVFTHPDLIAKWE
ncbi:MAG TPA: DUF2723 domain-containing protein [Chitinophagales bacterium]|nr:DUF2723 domain-containing protein [Chitinophagales bacterium]